MALDVFHQVLAKLLEAAGGDPRQMVPLVEVLKQEKLFGSVEMITTRLQSEGWIADAPKRDHVFVTTWGVEELRRSSSSVPPTVAKQAEPKNAAALRAAAEKARALAATLEEMAASTNGTAVQRKAKGKKALAAATEAVEEALG